MHDTCTPGIINEFITNVGLAICSTHHTVLSSTPGEAIFGPDVLSDIPCLSDWSEIGKRRQK